MERSHNFIWYYHCNYCHVLYRCFLPDKGYLTNFIGFIGAAILFVFLQEKDRIIFENRNKKKAILKYSPFLGLILLLLIIKVILPIYAKEDTAKYSRTTRRISMYADFENQRNKGYRYSESDAEFMAIMAHYTGKKTQLKLIRYLMTYIHYILHFPQVRLQLY